jgi:hypothetical protein
MGAHATRAGTYARVLGALLALTVITVLAAGFDFGPWNTVIALGIATIKASAPRQADERHYLRHRGGRPGRVPDDLHAGQQRARREPGSSGLPGLRCAGA